MIFQNLPELVLSAKKFLQLIANVLQFSNALHQKQVHKDALKGRSMLLTYILWE